MLSSIKQGYFGLGGGSWPPVLLFCALPGSLPRVRTRGDLETLAVGREAPGAITKKYALAV
eukprot:3520274-Alexandrium_andersonii.AAC.1